MLETYRESLFVPLPCFGSVVEGEVVSVSADAAEGLELPRFLAEPVPSRVVSAFTEGPFGGSLGSVLLAAVLHR